MRKLKISIESKDNLKENLMYLKGGVVK